MADQATLLLWKQEAETALHKLLIGSMSEKVTYNGHGAEFTPADVGKLRAYIAELNRQLGLGGRRKSARVYS